MANVKLGVCDDFDWDWLGDPQMLMLHIKRNGLDYGIYRELAEEHVKNGDLTEDDVKAADYLSRYGSKRGPLTIIRHHGTYRIEVEDLVFGIEKGYFSREDVECALSDYERKLDGLDSEWHRNFYMGGVEFLREQVAEL